MSNKTLHQLYAEHTGKSTDKWSLYLSEYDRLFNDYRAKQVRLLEIGVQNGGSLEIWSNYFGQASALIGCDIDPCCAFLRYDDPRIGVIVGDANAVDTRERVFERCSAFDIVIDDGSHRSGDIVKSFANYFPRLVDGGLFIVEDLHCSYWGLFDGGLFYPYSSISFFKRLADIVNHEHWGVERPRTDVLDGILANFSCEIDPEILSRVHSVEFINSMCVVRKRPAIDNGLGLRFIAGATELVVSGHQDLNGLPYALDPVLNQSENQWAVMAIPPDEAFTSLTTQVAERDGQIVHLTSDLADRDSDLADRDRQVVEWKGQVDDRDALVSRLTRDLTDRDALIAGLQHDAAELRDKLVSDVADRERQVVRWKRQVSDRDALVSGLTRDLADRDALIADLRHDVAELHDRLVALDTQVAERGVQIAGLDGALAERDALLAGLRQVVVAYQQSTSWRITRPMRSVVTAARSLRSGLNGTSSLSSSTPTAAAGEVLPDSRMHRGLRDVLLNRGYAFYRRYMKSTRVGRSIAAQILRRGLVSSAELQMAALSSDSLAPSQGSEALAARDDQQATVEQVEVDFSVHGFHFSPPLNFQISDALALHRKINVLLPSLRLKHMSGGPNTALLLAALLAEQGEEVRLIASDAPAEGEEAALFPHMEALVQRPVARERIELVDAFDRTRPTLIGAHDLFLATAWWTAQMAKYAVKKTVHKTFIYLIQDFEPILHEGSTFQARAMETYGLPHIPVINTRLLLDHLRREGAGSYADPEFASRALWFEPALDRNYYYPDPGNPTRQGKKVLLFYARPTVARRNLFEIGVVALRQAVASGAIDKDHWEVWAMGERLPSVALGNGVFLNPLPWMNFDDYAKRVRTADLLLSLMLSPHPSYPPLEMAASGKLVVTNSFSVKTAERMRALSPNILVADPTAESIGAALENAAGRINAGLPSYDPSGVIDLPSNWDQSMSDVVPELLRRIHELREALPATDPQPAQGLPTEPQTAYENYRRASLTRRRRERDYAQEPGLLSFITSAYNTDPLFLEELATSMFLQDGGMHFEWLILDNGSTNEGTCAALRSIAEHPGVRLERVEKNLGIIGGMRYLLERAQGRYVLPLDSDDLIEPDCVHVVTRSIKDNDYPPLLYTDEDKFDSERFGGPYFKPGWDPVLFLHSCFIAHLCAIDRHKALELALYTDVGAEGCHDWDSFIRFMIQGHVPLHIPEVLYSWRIHSGSTSGNIASKSYITESHRNTLQRFLNHSAVPHIDLVNSPLFNYNVDWWFKRRHVDPRSMQSITVGTTKTFPFATIPADGMRNARSFHFDEGIGALAAIVEQTGSELIHLCWEEIAPDGDEWRWDAMALLELFPDSVMVGGIVHDGSRIVDGPRVFGFGNGFDCPDSGRLLSDPGYGAKMWKPHSVSSASTAHCVVRADFLKACMPELIEEGVAFGMLGPWLGALAAESGKRVIYSPFMRALSTTTIRDVVSPKAREHFLSRFWPLIPDSRVYSPRLGLDAARRYEEVTPDENQRHCADLQRLLLPYPEWLAMRIRQRATAYPAPEDPAGLTLITTVYEGTSIGLLDALAASITGQTANVAQWVIVVHGPVTPENVVHIVSQGAAHWKATVVIEPSPLGIMGAMRRGLDHAVADYIVPVDADDVLTPDAVQILTSAIATLDRPDLIFSDEDLFVAGRPASPYLRSAFDPVLHLDSSYIWHLCAIDRARATALALYSDMEATWCHDWDSVMRVWNAGGRIEHVPEVLYHWRQHASSTTNNAQGDSRSLDSVRHLLERQIARMPNPQHFYVTEWPEYRGAKELYIARATDDSPPFIWIGDAAAEAACQDDAVLVVAANGVLIGSQQVFSEVARLFELHPRIGAVGGLVTNKDGLVVDACSMVNRAGTLESPWTGHLASFSGAYALALKTQTVAATGECLAFFRIAALKQVGAWPLRAGSNVSDQVTHLCDRLSAGRWTIAFSPLIRARSESIGKGVTGRHRAGPVIDASALVNYGMARSFRI